MNQSKLNHTKEWCLTHLSMMDIVIEMIVVIMMIIMITIIMI